MSDATKKSIEKPKSKSSMLFPAPTPKMRDRSAVASEFAKAETEHTAAVIEMQSLANKRMALLLELKRIDNPPELPELEVTSELPSIKE